MTTPPKTEWRDDVRRLSRRDFANDDLVFRPEYGGSYVLSPDDARFLLRVLPEALGEPRLSVPALPTDAEDERVIDELMAKRPTRTTPLRRPAEAPRETPRARDAIADRFGAGDSIAELAADYDITPEAVEACVRVERRADAAIVEAAERWNERALAVVESGVFALAAYELAGQELHRAVQAKRSALNK